MKKIDENAFRDALGQYATGVTIATTIDEKGFKVGMTVTSFNSLSLDPPLVLWSIDKATGCFDAFYEAKYFAIQVLSEDQEDLSNKFAGKGFDKFKGVKTTCGLGNVPILVEYCVCFQCKIEHHYEGGDHIIFVGRVLEIGHQKAKPLLFHNGTYKKFK